MVSACQACEFRWTGQSSSGIFGQFTFCLGKPSNEETEIVRLGTFPFFSRDIFLSSFEF